MNKITVDIKDIVHKSLLNERRKKLKDNFKQITYESTDDFIKKHIEKSVELINEGYDVHEVAGALGDVTQKVKDVTGDFDFQKTFTDSFISMLKEFGIKWVLDYFGFNETVSTYLAQGLADVSPKDFFLTFKNVNTCYQHAPVLLDAILEVLARQAGSKLTGMITGTNKEDEMQSVWAKQSRDAMKQYEKDLKKYKRGELETEPIKPKIFEPKYEKNKYNWGDIPGIYAGNILGDIIRDTSTSETLAKPLCELIHNIKTKLTSN